MAKSNEKIWQIINVHPEKKKVSVDMVVILK